ncbi:hypothetical protein JOF34_002034 [Microbacterium amylolyticum]|uniref:Uncharacterized protein n=1 Tax=Microbacterium amylolyticum TaxID=936337 RepID=A0ABS4ZKA0_9MICO|nr:hypothetical protein [Microbacterium amylolyticum]
MVSKNLTRAARFAAAGTVVALVALPLAACSAGDGAETVRFTFSKREAIEFMTDVVADYNASQNDFMMPSLIISDPALQTLPVRQHLFQNQFSNSYNVAFASYLMAMAPAIVAYLFTQPWVMEGVTQGAVKG